MAHKYSSMSAQGVDQRRRKGAARKGKSLRAGTLTVSDAELSAYVERINAVTQARRNRAVVC